MKQAITFICCLTIMVRKKWKDKGNRKNKKKEKQINNNKDKKNDKNRQNDKNKEISKKNSWNKMKTINKKNDHNKEKKKKNNIFSIITMKMEETNNNIINISRKLLFMKRESLSIK